MRRILFQFLLALSLQPSQAHDEGFVLRGGMSSAGVSAGLGYIPDESYRIGVRAAYLPGVHAFDAHIHWLLANVKFPTYFGAEVIYLYDTVFLSSREFPRFEWIAAQGIIGHEFGLTPRLGLALEGGGGITLWSDNKTVGAGVPIDIPMSIIARAELLFGI